MEASGRPDQQPAHTPIKWRFGACVPFIYLFYIDLDE